MSHPGELFGSRASRASLSSTTQSCFTAGERICNVNVTLVYDLLTNHYPSTHAPTSMYFTPSPPIVQSPTWKVKVSVLSFLLTASWRQLLSSQDISSSFCLMLLWICSMIDAMQSLVRPG